MFKQICKKCNSENVARLKWVNVNTEEIYNNDTGTTLEWCFNCYSETNIIEKPCKFNFDYIIVLDYNNNSVIIDNIDEKYIEENNEFNVEKYVTDKGFKMSEINYMFSKKLNIIFDTKDDEI